MTHFNHEYTAGIPDSVGDRFYAQDLNDNFNYLKHLSYEMAFQGKNGIVVMPKYTFDKESRMLTFEGGIGAVRMNATVVNENEAWAIPPKTKQEMRYERVEFTDTALDLNSNENPDQLRYIVVTPVKKSFASRVKALVGGDFVSRVKYTGTISLSYNQPDPNQILLGFARPNEFLILDRVQPEDRVVVKEHRIWSSGMGSDLTYSASNAYPKVLAALGRSADTPVQTNISGGSLNLTLPSLVVDSKITQAGIDNINDRMSVTTTNSTTGSILKNCELKVSALASGTRKLTLDGCTVNLPRFAATVSVVQSVIFKDCDITCSPLNNSSATMKSCTLEGCKIIVNKLNTTSPAKMFEYIHCKKCVFDINCAIKPSDEYAMIHIIDGGDFDDCTFDSSANASNAVSGIYVYKGAFFYNSAITNCRFKFGYVRNSYTYDDTFVDYVSLFYNCKAFNNNYVTIESLTSECTQPDNMINSSYVGDNAHKSRCSVIRNDSSERANYFNNTIIVDNVNNGMIWNGSNPEYHQMNNCNIIINSVYMGNSQQSKNNTSDGCYLFTRINISNCNFTIKQVSMRLYLTVTLFHWCNIYDSNIQALSCTGESTIYTFCLCDQLTYTDNICRMKGVNITTSIATKFVQLINNSTPVQVNMTIQSIASDLSDATQNLKQWYLVKGEIFDSYVYIGSLYSEISIASRCINCDIQIGRLDITYTELSAAQQGGVIRAECVNCSIRVISWRQGWLFNDATMINCGIGIDTLYKSISLGRDNKYLFMISSGIHLRSAMGGSTLTTTGINGKYTAYYGLNSINAVN